MYPDVSHTTSQGQPLTGKLDSAWLTKEFIPEVQQRGTAIINARKASSAASAASAAVDHMRDWALGSNGRWVSMAVPSDLYNGEYGIPKGVIFSYPMVCTHGVYHLVRGLKIDEFSREKLKVTSEELLKEREAIVHLLKN
jgi:malate dehydrogenase